MTMRTTIYYVLLWLTFLWPIATEESNHASLESEFSIDNHQVHHGTMKVDEMDMACFDIHPTARDIVKRFYAIIAYFDKDHLNKEFLHKFRGTVNSMSENEDLLDREAAFYATVLVPVIFLQSSRDTWCLLERFHRALRLYSVSHPTEKRSALKLLQNLRAVNNKVRSFILELPGITELTTQRVSSGSEAEEEEIRDKKDLRYLKELIKNLG